MGWLGRGARSKVPYIVRQCVEEVEKRGIEEVGIYRISGVATDIQALKAVFDATVTVSQQAVGGTGALRDPGGFVERPGLPTAEELCSNMLVHVKMCSAFREGLSDGDVPVGRQVWATWCECGPELWGMNLTPQSPLPEQPQQVDPSPQKLAGTLGPAFPGETSTEMEWVGAALGGLGGQNRLRLHDHGSSPADNKDILLMLSDMDINAIAGTLKLYFRELPEPLLTDRLYPAFMEGIGEALRAPGVQTGLGQDSLAGEVASRRNPCGLPCCLTFLGHWGLGLRAREWRVACWDLV
ncbi:hypothetical protein P7K49_010178 [Saguinus oedipus]|uniref:Rho-GAP domain-containing protein n=1 Tax=Saguinus oedipus TaxID=9490 RepID=A0ABQ9VM33_SAGOE|nr:hypothetical protein P7K49_010178 [Saguinus oedipus]